MDLQNQQLRGGVWNFRRSTAKYVPCEALSWHGCRSSQYPERFSELWSYPVGKIFWAPGKSEKSWILHNLSRNFCTICSQIGTKSRIWSFPGVQKLFPMRYEYNSENLPGYCLDLQLCQPRASHDTYFATDRQKFKTSEYLIIPLL